MLSDSCSTLIFYIFAGLNLRRCIDAEVHESGLRHGSFNELSSKMSLLLVKSKSDSTVSKYYSYFKKWEDFITSKGGVAIPAEPIHVALYLTELIDKQSSSSIVSNVVYSLKWAHSLRNLHDPTDNLFVKNLLEASKRLLTKPKTRKDIVTTDNLIMLCDKYIQSDDILVLRDLAMILIAFAGFLRFDELSSLRCNDVIFHDSHISIRIRKSKTDQYRHGDRIVISKGESVACPYTMLQRYMRVAGLSVTDDTFLFKPCYRSKNINFVDLFSKIRHLVIRELENVLFCV